MGICMEEKIYKTMSGSGALNIVVGVVTLVAGRSPSYCKRGKAVIQQIKDIILKGVGIPSWGMPICPLFGRKLGGMECFIKKTAGAEEEAGIFLRRGSIRKRGLCPLSWEHFPLFP